MKPYKDRIFKAPAKGNLSRGHAKRPRVSVSFDRHQIDALNARAEANGRSFGAEVRCIVEAAIRALSNREGR